MLTCHICRFEVELDDVVLRHEGGQCICLRCYCRETASAMPMPKALHRDITAVLSTVEAPAS